MRRRLNLSSATPLILTRPARSRRSSTIWTAEPEREKVLEEKKGATRRTRRKKPMPGGDKSRTLLNGVIG